LVEGKIVPAVLLRHEAK